MGPSWYDNMEIGEQFLFWRPIFAGKYNQVPLLVQRSTIAHFYRNDLNFKYQLKNGVIIDQGRQEITFSDSLKILVWPPFQLLVVLWIISIGVILTSKHVMAS